ncbi:all-trans retinoic acid-induced differentiation factor isoform 2-T2 [Porphyrio hochstetteri]
MGAELLLPPPLLLLLLLLPPPPWAAGGAAVCERCPGPVQNGSIVAQYCKSRAGTESEGRCCRERGARPERLLGLDLSDCSLRSLPPGLAEATAVIVLDLSENPLMPLPEGSLLGFTHLQHLAVPLPLECPGGSSAWEEDTTNGTRRLCQGQRNPCNGSGDHAWPCPENTACVPDGPGVVQCFCQDPFHGYKCLREGTFPVLVFCAILGAVTVSLSLLLWGTQRRKVKSPWAGRGAPSPGGLRVPGSGSPGGSGG